ncbi:hypothetical protein G9444_0774 [Rhodococcus erythropolis]|uniref:Uncharacterized protein n=1 Tax=Rhodococcus erythropolis TaxID=1833 RepID=A0A6G9CMB0_RHOER|nr:hypothetical protein [Rhodococcus erythropolis]QIP38018.1 hypothetical protein G9444_0774 [Rhodococcus erythropolis]
MLNEVRIPFSLSDLPVGEELPLSDVDAFIPYLTEKWPAGGRPHHVELLQGDGRKPPAGIDGWLVFRVSAPEPERDPEAPTVDWNKVLEARLAERRSDDDE